MDSWNAKKVFSCTEKKSVQVLKLDGTLRDRVLKPLTCPLSCSSVLHPPSHLSSFRFLKGPVATGPTVPNLWDFLRCTSVYPSLYCRSTFLPSVGWLDLLYCFIPETRPIDRWLWFPGLTRSSVFIRTSGPQVYPPVFPFIWTRSVTWSVYRFF